MRRDLRNVFDYEEPDLLACHALTLSDAVVPLASTTERPSVHPTRDHDATLALPVQGIEIV